MNLDFHIQLYEKYNIDKNFYNKGQFIVNFFTENKQIETMTKDLEMNNNCLMQKRGRKTHFSNKKEPYIGINFGNMKLKFKFFFPTL